ncbi:MAG TPA: hypothetical protein VJT75_18165, partial [Thermoleophilaceae bacterium]|nr:hypothetical protein [Thermoleophilaceae bacterium]
LGGSGSSAALAAAAVVTWLGIRRVRAPEVAPLDELSRWWADLPLARRALAGALAGVWAVCQVWLLRHPTLGFDSVVYHLSEAAVWAGSGHPGATDPVIRTLPVTSYPITDEVFASWSMGLGRSFVPVSFLVPAQMVLLGLASWAGLRTLRVPPLPRTLATAAVVCMPAVIAWQSNGALTDPAALAWLVACAALCAGARERPALLAPAVVAGGLAIGTKTTTAILTLAVLAWALWSQRARLRGLWRPLALAALLALGSGGVWYLRNLLDHGSPLWPFVATPWGTPLPRAMGTVNDSFAEHPRETIRVVGDLYRDRFLGGVVLLAAGALAPLLAWRQRAVWIASAACVVSFLAWTRAPFTGVPPAPFRITEGVFSTTRYLAPAIAAAALALALAGSGRGVRARLAQLALAAGAGIELVQAFDLGWPTMPSATTPVAGAAAGAAVATIVSVASRRPRRAPPRMLRPALLVSALALGALLTVPADGYMQRHADSGAFAHGLTAWMAGRPEGSRSVWTAPATVATLTGDHLERRLRPIPARADCAAIRAHARDDYVVAYVGRLPGGGARGPAACFTRPPSYSDDAFRVWAPTP